MSNGIVLGIGARYDEDTSKQIPYQLTYQNKSVKIFLQSKQRKHTCGFETGF